MPWFWWRHHRWNRNHCTTSLCRTSNGPTRTPPPPPLPPLPTTTGFAAATPLISTAAASRTQNPTPRIDPTPSRSNRRRLHRTTTPLPRRWRRRMGRRSRGSCGRGGRSSRPRRAPKRKRALITTTVRTTAAITGWSRRGWGAWRKVGSRTVALIARRKGRFGFRCRGKKSRRMFTPSPAASQPAAPKNGLRMFRNNSMYVGFNHLCVCVCWCVFFCVLISEERVRRSLYLIVECFLFIIIIVPLFPQGVFPGLYLVGVAADSYRVMMSWYGFLFDFYVSWYSWCCYALHVLEMCVILLHKFQCHSLKDGLLWGNLMTSSTDWALAMVNTALNLDCGFTTLAFTQSELLDFIKFLLSSIVVVLHRS